MTTTADLIRFLDATLINPVLTSGGAVNQRCVRFARMCLWRLPARSAALYCLHGASGTAPNRACANDAFEAEGFASFRTLIPVMDGLFADVWPKT